MTSWMTSLRTRSSARDAISSDARHQRRSDHSRQSDDTRALAQAIVDTVREPLLVLDKELRVIAASRSFYETFQAAR